MTKQTNAISPKRSEDYPEWYQQVIKAAELAEHAPVRGCMVIKPWGFGIWELMQRALDDMIKATGHVNASFPMLIPLSFLEKEAEHVEGFAKECAVVTHHRLAADADGTLKPTGELDEPLVVRPTSETIIGHSYARWVQSYRDLPILINQWANVLRWEMRPRLFLRTTEFLWQEGHTAHATAAEARQETLQMHDLYEEFARTWLAIPVLKGKKTPSERFPGAVDTYTIEAMMQDGKALQAGTSHFLGQNFAKASGIRFVDAAGDTQYAWTTSWGVSTRLLGALIMTHSDDDGLVLPPRVAPQQVVVVPVGNKVAEQERVHAYARDLVARLRKKQFAGGPLRVLFDERELRGGEKIWQHIKKGVPLRLEVGPRDLERREVCVAERHQPRQNKAKVPCEGLEDYVVAALEKMQVDLLEQARLRVQERTRLIDNLDDFAAFFAPDQEHGFALCHWHEEALEHPLLSQYKVSPRCISMDPTFGGASAEAAASGICPFTGKPSEQRVVLAKSY